MAMPGGQSIFYGLVILTSCAMAGNIGANKMQELRKEDVARQVALEYVIQVKRWKRDEFKIQIASENNNVIVIDVVHNDDLRGSKGSNKSIQLYVDTARAVVTKELGYQ